MTQAVRVRFPLDTPITTVVSIKGMQRILNPNEAGSIPVRPTKQEKEDGSQHFERCHTSLFLSSLFVLSGVTQSAEVNLLQVGVVVTGSNPVTGCSRRTTWDVSIKAMQRPFKPSEAGSIPVRPTMKNCYLCKENKPKMEFNKNSSKKDGLQSMCRSCNKIKAKRYYAENRIHHRSVCTRLKKKRIAENQEVLFELFCRSCCVDCGNTNPLVLEFDHIADKESSISKLLANGCSWQRILREIKKCQMYGMSKTLFISFIEDKAKQELDDKLKSINNFKK